MKKVVFGILVLLITAAFTIQSNRRGSTATLAPENSAQTVQETLNGVDSATAVAMIAHFNTYGTMDKEPKRKFVWFRKEILDAIVSLLKTEKEADGIRIYFASDPSSNTFPLKTSILLVTTKENGIDTTAPYQSGMKHQDYYSHSSAAGLFKLDSLGGTIREDVIKCTGARLYDTTTNEKDDPSCPSPHNIPIKLAKRMVTDDAKGYGYNTTAEWFDRQLIETLASEKRCNGIRIYFAIRPADTLYRENRNSFVITTTEAGVDKYSNSPDYYDCVTAKKYQKKYNDRYPESKFHAPPKDNGELCPNHCN